MVEYFWLIGLILIPISLDFAIAAARLEMYKALKRLFDKGINEVPLSLYSSICFYLIPEDGIVKFTQRLPITYFFDRKIKNMLKDKTYEGESILERLEAIKNFKCDDIKNKAIYAVLPKGDRDKIL